MRALAQADSIRRFMQALGRRASGEARVYLTGLVEPHRRRELYGAIEPRLYRYPAIDPPSFRRALETALTGRS